MKFFHLYFLEICFCVLSELLVCCVYLNVFSFKGRTEKRPSVDCLCSELQITCVEHSYIISYKYRMVLIRTNIA